MFDQIFKSKCNKKRLKVIFMIMSELRECESKHVIDYNHIFRVHVMIHFLFLFI